MQKIMVVEDDDNIRDVVSEYLLVNNYDAVLFSNGADALSLIKSNQETQSNDIDLYVLDIMLPGVSGITLLEEIRGMGNAPVIMLTALNDEQTQLSSFNRLADDYITKPFSPKILIKRIEAILRRSKGDTNILKVRSVIIDVESYEAYEDGELLELTLKELEILKALMINPGKVLTRQQLLNIAWGYDYFGDERIVDVHIKNLRKKLKSNILQTVKGVGYKVQ